MAASSPPENTDTKVPSVVWCVVWPAGAPQREARAGDGKIIRILPFGSTFKASEVQDGWLSVDHGSYVLAFGQRNAAVFAAKADIVNMCAQYVVTSPERALTFSQEPKSLSSIISTEEEKKGSHGTGFPIPSKWVLLALEERNGWIHHPAGWSRVNKRKQGWVHHPATGENEKKKSGIDESGLTKITSPKPVIGAKMSDFYPQPEYLEKASEDSSKMDSKNSDATPEPPKKTHSVRAFDYLKVDEKSVIELANIKKLSKQHKKAIIGIVACLLRGYSSNAEEAKESKLKWQIGYLTHLASNLGLSKREIMGLTPLLESVTDPKGFIEALPGEAFSKKAEGDAKNAGVDLSPERLRLPVTLVHRSIQIMGYYDARVRQMVRDLCTTLDIPLDLFSRYEDIYSHALRMTVQAVEEAKEKRAQNWKWRWAKIGGVAVVGGVVTALTAGLAAPLVGAGLVAVGGGTALAGAGAFLATSGGAMFFGGVIGGYATRVIGYRVDNRIADVKEFEFVPLSKKATPDSEEASISVIMCIGGWHLDEEKIDEEMKYVWAKRFTPTFAPGKEVYGLRWETKELVAFGNALSDIVKKQMTGYAISKGIAMTAFHAIAVAVALPVMLIDLTQIIDNAYHVAMNRTDKAALLLADALRSRVQGRRPVTLVAYSLGARMVFNALEILANERKGATNNHGDGSPAAPTTAPPPPPNDTKNGKEKGKVDVWDEGKDDPEGIILDVILLGTPVSGDPIRWKKVRSVVSGRLVNVYSMADWVLRLLYRTSEASLSLAGIQPIDCEGVENINLTDRVMDHFAYDTMIPEIMEILKFYP